MRRVALSLGSLVLLAGIGTGLAHVGALAGEEVDRSGDVVAVRDAGAAPLVRATLREGQQAFFEACADDRFAGGWEDVAFEIWHLGDGALAQRVEASQWLPRARGAEGHACAVVLRWESVLVGGEYGLRIDGVPAAAPNARVRGRMAAWRALGDGHLVGILLAFSGGIVLLAGLALRPAPPAAFDALAADALAEVAPARPGWLATWTDRPPALRVGMALLLLLGVMIGLSAFTGTLFGLIAGLLLAAAEVALAFTFVAPRAPEPARGTALGLVRPRPGGWWILLLAPPVGLALWMAGGLLSRLIPSTGVSPVEAFVSFPSGALALGVVAVIVPIAEELFFRGFVYGAVEERHGRAMAFAVTVVVFAVAHLPQQWGAWGPFAAVAFTGLVLTALRAGTRSTVVPAAAHLTHNALITALALS